MYYYKFENAIMAYKTPKDNPKYIAITEAEYNEIKNSRLANKATNNDPKVKELQAKLSEVQRWFYSTDWIPNKIITGEWSRTDKRWINYMYERKQHRDLQDKLTEELNKLNETN